MAPDAVVSSMSDKNEFTKFAKFLAYKGVQVIVESRKGEKIEDNSSSIHSDSDWFNLQIPDSPEVNQATKSALPSDKVLETFKAELHVEISVQTEEGDEMVLELWTFSLDETQYDPALKAMNTVYFRMGILLKSLIAITRITPAYHLSRQQRTESFTIFYRVFSGEPKNKLLGDSVKKIQVGMLKTPRGGIKFSVDYRTDMSISPNKSSKTDSLQVKSDHFELSPKHMIFDSKAKQAAKEKPPLDLNKPLRLAAFADESLVKEVFDEFLSKYPLPKCRAHCPYKTAERTAESKSTQELDTSITSKSPTSFEMPPKKFPGFRSENEPPLKLLYFPFADHHPIRELAEFYKDLFNAPHLKLEEDMERSRSRSPGVEGDDDDDESRDDLSHDLELYENHIEEFDKLLDDMCKSAEMSSS